MKRRARECLGPTHDPLGQRVLLELGQIHQLSETDSAGLVGVELLEPSELSLKL